MITSGVVTLIIALIAWLRILETSIAIVGAIDEVGVCC
jgi:hypothetical protein